MPKYNITQGPSTVKRVRNGLQSSGAVIQGFRGEERVRNGLVLALVSSQVYSSHSRTLLEGGAAQDGVQRVTPLGTLGPADEASSQAPERLGQRSALSHNFGDAGASLVWQPPQPSGKGRFRYLLVVRLGCSDRSPGCRGGSSVTESTRIKSCPLSQCPGHSLSL